MSRTLQMVTGRKRPRQLELRMAQRTEAERLHTLIMTHREEGHLLPRALEELTRHAPRFLVAVDRERIVACGELAPLSGKLAEIRSLVVDHQYRGSGVGRRLVEELREQARLGGYGRLCVFSHQPGYFARMGFSIVPHIWLPEKIGTDCSSCVLFRRCGQFAMLDDLALSREIHALRGLMAHA